MVSKSVRENILRCSMISGHGHIPTCFSVVELLLGVYQTMQHRPDNPLWEDRDIFILSKGHAALGYYCVLAEMGYFKINQVESFGHAGSRFGCHADRTKVPGVELSTGSLGHGIGVAVGIALALKIKKSKRKVYTLIGDGESNEGSVWEAIMVAVNLELSNLTIILDYNKSQTRCLPLTLPYEKLKSFGCDVKEINGHEPDEINVALNEQTNSPKAIVAHTVKGYGCQTLIDNVFEWHRNAPNQNQFEQLLRELYA